MLIITRVVRALGTGNLLFGYRTAKKTDNALVCKCVDMKMSLNKYMGVVVSASIYYYAYALACLLI